LNLSPVRSIEDVLSIEQSEQWLPEGVKCTYDYLHKGSQINPEAIALSFFMKAVDYKIPVQFNYQQWIEGITRTANMLRELGIQRGDVVAYVLPNLPETHWVIWGAETAGIAFALNPLLDGAALRDLMVSAKVKWLVTLAPTPGIKLWEEVSAIATDVPSLKGIIAISPYKHLSGFARSLLLIWKQFKTPKFIGRLPVLDFHRELVRQKSKELNFLLPDLEDVASYFCTGGTTGLPKIPMNSPNA
jgi:acyl-coenzyme A synthetase/AMP-(fatty) acid ligase